MAYKARTRAVSQCDDLHSRHLVNPADRNIREPGDGDRAPEQPRLLRRTIDLLVEENVMPLDTIPRHIGLMAHDIEMLVGLPEGYFQVKPNVARLRSAVGNSQAPVSTESSIALPFRSIRK